MAIGRRKRKQILRNMTRREVLRRARRNRRSFRTA